MERPLEPNHKTVKCPDCHSKYRQTKAGYTVDGNQRYQCQDCKRNYCEENRRYRYPLALRQQAAHLHTSGLSIRHIARELSVNHQTVNNWLRLNEVPQSSGHLAKNKGENDRSQTETTE